MKKKSFLETIRLIRSDIQKCIKMEKYPRRGGFFYVITRPNLLAISLYRLTRYFYLRGNYFLTNLIYSINGFLTKSDIYYKSEINDSFYIKSPIFCYVYGNIGSNVSLDIHAAVVDDDGDIPTIKNNVYISASSIVCGSVSIDHNLGVKEGSIVSSYNSRAVNNKNLYKIEDADKNKKKMIQRKNKKNNSVNKKTLTFKKTLQLIHSDIQRFSEEIEPPIKKLTFFRTIKILFLPNVVAIALYRISRYFYVRNHTFLSRIIWNTSILLTGADINPVSDIGKRFIMVHATGTIIAGRLGDNCKVFAQVGIGKSSNLSDIGAGQGLPWICDNVTIGGRASMIGPIRVGNNVKIAPHTFITEDVPDNVVISGNPAKIIRKRETSYPSEPDLTME